MLNITGGRLTSASSRRPSAAADTGRSAATVSGILHLYCSLVRHHDEHGRDVFFRWHDGGDEEIPGTWKQIAYERHGVIEPLDEQGWEPRVTFTGDTCVVTLADGRIPIKGTYKLDPTRDPKTVDWTDTIGDDDGKTLLAIYSLEADRRVFCAAYPGQARPTEFRTRPGQVLRVSQREKPTTDNKDRRWTASRVA